MNTSLDDQNFGTWLASATECKSLVFQDIDFTPYDATLAALAPAASAAEGCVFLGCTFGSLFLDSVVKNFGMILPELKGEKGVYKSFRSKLYTVEELFAGYAGEPSYTSYQQTPDWRIYTSAYAVKQPDAVNAPWQFVSAGALPVRMDETVARRLHDSSMEEATDEFLAPYLTSPSKGIVAIMGGHDVSRKAPIFREIVMLAHQLTTAGYLVVTGGGPGLMEAGNLGGFLAHREISAVDEALAILTMPKAAKYNDELWLHAAWKVRQQFPADEASEKRVSLGIPTWFYGHEPPNVFASHIAKYFENSLREEGLLSVAVDGLIVGEGNGGTVQEIFQDACQNYYATYHDTKSPMILIGEEYWNSTAIPNKRTAKHKPLWPLLRAMAQLGGFADKILLTDDLAEVLAFIKKFSGLRKAAENKSPDAAGLA